MKGLFVHDVRLRDAQEPTRILIRDGVVWALGRGLSPPPCLPVLRGEGRTALPGFVDLHAHFRDPGFPEKETIESGSWAAAHGGYTAVSLMPNTDPVCDSPEVARYMAEEGRRHGLVEVYPVGAITRNLAGEELGDMEAMSPYVWAFSDDGHGVEDHELMFRACKAAAELGRVIFPHPEFAHVSDRGLSEELELLRDLWLCRRTGCRLHIAHLSTPGAVELCALAKAKGLPVTCEVTPHHLGLCREEVGYTVNPPLGDRATREALRQALKEGVIDAIATDHAPHTREDKDHGAPGISGIETAFPLLYTSLVREGLLSLAELSQYLSLGPARVLGLPKGAIQVGKDGDLVLVEEDEPLYVTDGFFLSRGHNSPLLGMKLWGKVWATVHRGEVVHVDGKVRGRDFDDYRQVI